MITREDAKYTNGIGCSTHIVSWEKVSYKNSIKIIAMCTREELKKMSKLFIVFPLGGSITNDF